MNPNKLFPLIITDKLEETKTFYLDKAGWVLTIEMDNYLQVRATEDPSSPELAFMRPCEASPMGAQTAFGGSGIVVSVPTPDADQMHRRYKKAGVPIMNGPQDKPWGWRSFLARDPNGLVLDIFHVLEQSSAQDATG